MRNKILGKAKEIKGVSILQISRVTGITRQAIKKSRNLSNKNRPECTTNVLIKKSRNLSNKNRP